MTMGLGLTDHSDYAIICNRFVTDRTFFVTEPRGAFVARFERNGFMTKKHPIGSRFLCLIFSFACVLTLLRPVMASVDTSAVISDTTYTANIRNRASYSATVIGKMEDDTLLTILEERGEFFKVDCYDMTGFIAREQVELRQDGKYYVNCDPDSDETKVLRYQTQDEARTVRDSIYALAKRQLGYPYVYGGTRPGGFDCSGLTMYLYSKHDYSIHRTASQQLQDGVIVAKDELEVGDLIFFRVAYETYPASHVGIYVGDGKIIHAGSRGIVYAELDGPWFRDYYLCARRIVNTSRTGIGQTPLVSAESAVTYRRGAGLLRTAGK